MDLLKHMHNTTILGAAVWQMCIYLRTQQQKVVCIEIIHQTVTSCAAGCKCLPEGACICGGGSLSAHLWGRFWLRIHPLSHPIGANGHHNIGFTGDGAHRQEDSTFARPPESTRFCQNWQALSVFLGRNIGLFQRRNALIRMHRICLYNTHCNMLIL
jgi:hypothetical protein